MSHRDALLGFKGSPYKVKTRLKGSKKQGGDIIMSRVPAQLEYLARVYIERIYLHRRFIEDSESLRAVGFTRCRFIQNRRS